MADAHRLTFQIPNIMLLAVPVGRHQPCLAGCVLIVGPSGLVSIEGPSRDRVFDQARRFFRVHARKLPAFQVAAHLAPPRAHHSRSGLVTIADCWTIAVNSDVTFAPTGLGADLSPPQQTIFSAG